MKSLSDLMRERVLILDGGMGTEILNNTPTEEDYGGKEFHGCIEILNANRKEWIQKIHEDYLNAGADAVETNTFSCNPLALAEFNISEKAYALNVAAVTIAKEVSRSFSTPKFVIGSVGPGGKILSFMQTSYEIMFSSYFIQMLALAEAGVDAILIETSQDIAQIRLAVSAANKAMQSSQKQCQIWVQFTLDSSGTTLTGSSVLDILQATKFLGIDVLGINCSSGPENMELHLAHLKKSSPFALSFMPNAGLPILYNGKYVYPYGPELFANEMFRLAQDYSLRIVGGCCGTTPEHIKMLSDRFNNYSFLN